MLARLQAPATTGLANRRHDMLEQARERAVAREELRAQVCSGIASAEPGGWARLQYKQAGMTLELPARMQCMARLFSCTWTDSIGLIRLLQTAEQKQQERYIRDSEVARELQHVQQRHAVLTAQDQQVNQQVLNCCTTDTA